MRILKDFRAAFLFLSMLRFSLKHINEWLILTINKMQSRCYSYTSKYQVLEKFVSLLLSYLAIFLG